MKLKKAPTAKLSSNNLKAVQAYADTKLVDTPYYDLLRVLGDMFDTIAKGDNCYAVIGAVSNKTAFSVTVTVGDDKDSRYGPSIDEVAALAQEWL